MPPIPFEDATREAEAALSELKAGLSDTQRAELVARISRLLVSAAERERARAIQLCRQRAQLWRTTLAASIGHAAAQAEARARANEAEYLADLLAEKGGEPSN